GEPAATRKTSALAGVVDEMTKPAIVTQIAAGIVATTSFEGLINTGNVRVDDEKTRRFRFQPIASEGVALPTSYKGTSGGGLWQFFLGMDDFSVVQARLVGGAFLEN